MMADSGVATGYDYRLAVMAGLLLLLGCAVDNTNSYQRPRDGYNTFSDTSTVLPGGAPSTLNGIMHPKWSEPYFDISVPRNVTALVGKSAYLSCRVRNLGNKTVSWIRHRDLHILTVATYTYTTDQRFQTSYHRDVSEWTLQIKWAQERDAGTYECQVSTQPVKSYSVQLKVVGPHEINDTNATMRQRYGGGHHHDEQQPPPPYQRDSPLNRAYNDDGGDGGGDGDGTDDMHDNAGGDQQLQPNDNAAGVDWEADDDYDDSRAASIADGLPDSRTSAFWRWWQANEPPDTGRPQARVPTAAILGGPDLYVDKGSTINLTCAIHFSPEPPAYIFWYHLNKVISYDSARIRMETIKGEPSVSYLLIHDADLADSGKYSCSPSGTGVSHIRVHVLNGERPEAMQTSGAAAPTPSIRSVIGGGGGGGGLMVLAFLISIIMVQQHLTVPHEAAADIAQQQQQQYHRQRLTYQLDSKTGRPQQQCGGEYAACASCIVNDWRIGAAGYR